MGRMISWIRSPYPSGISKQKRVPLRLSTVKFEKSLMIMTTNLPVNTARWPFPAVPSGTKPALPRNRTV